MFTGQCHCGNISFSIDHAPDTLTECNCSICSRYGTRWAYFKPADVTITVRDEPSKTYRWGDKMIDFHHCPKCGCVTHYTATELVDEPTDRMAVNARLAPRETTENIRIRHFDGANTWKYLD